jgi:hypothetical protein
MCATNSNSPSRHGMIIEVMLDLLQAIYEHLDVEITGLNLLS